MLHSHDNYLLLIIPSAKDSEQQYVITNQNNNTNIKCI